MQLSEYEQQSLEKLQRAYYEGRWSNAGLVSLSKLVVEDLLNAKRVEHYARDNHLTPQGARKFRPHFTLDGYQFIPDND